MSGAAAIQSVAVRGHEERREPKPHVVFRIEIAAHVRQWTMWRRYSEFDDLLTELSKSTGAPPPAPLPPKHSLSLFRARSDPALLEERRAGLEAFLRAIVGAKDARWRDDPSFRAFLGVPVGRAGGEPALGGAAWLDEQLDVAGAVRNARAALSRRDALGDAGDAGGAHAANVEAKRTLAGALARVGALAAALDEAAKGGMAPGEVQRRADMLGRLQDECEKIGRMAGAARFSSRALGPQPAASSDREALLGGAGGSGAGGGATRVTRVFGQKAAPVETAATRPLDAGGLVQLQQEQVAQQDQQLAGLTAILQRQRQLGLAIHGEIVAQNEMLDGLNDDVDRFGDKMASAKKMLNKVSK